MEDINRKRHKLLGILSIQRNNFNLKKASNNTQAIDFETILKELNCNEDELQIITSELYSCDEIDDYTYSFKGLFAKKNGLTSFSNKKYVNIIRKNRIENAKSFVQIVIPIFSLIIAYVAITTKSENIQKQYGKELQEVKLLLIQHKARIKTLEYRIEKILENKKSGKIE